MYKKRCRDYPIRAHACIEIVKKIKLKFPKSNIMITYVVSWLVVWWRIFCWNVHHYGRTQQNYKWKQFHSLWIEKLLGMNSSAKKDKPSFLEQYAGFWWHFFWISQGIKLKELSTSWSKWWRAGAAALKNRFHCRSWLYKSNRIWCSKELEQIHDGSSNPQHFETHPNATT